MACWPGLRLALGDAIDTTGLDWRPPASRLGLDPQKLQYSVGCGASLLPCGEKAPPLAGNGLRWSVELGALTPADLSGRAMALGRQGLNLSLVGRKPLFGSSFSVYGKLGTTYAASDPALAAAVGPGAGASDAAMACRTAPA